MEKLTEAEKAAARRGNVIFTVRNHAENHYEEDGWDEVVEAWTDDEIWREVKNCSTPEYAIKAMHRIVKMRKAYADEIRSA